jgi:SnoaL-like protein
MADDIEARLAVLEQRVRELEDEREIRSLLGWYAYFADGCHDEQWLDLWTDDGVYDISAGRWVGKRRLREFISDPQVHHSPGFYGHTLHLQGPNLAISIHGDDAVATGYNVLLHETFNVPTILRIGGNRWRFRRVSGRWLMAERRHRSVGETEFAANLTHLPIDAPSGS